MRTGETKIIRGSELREKLGAISRATLSRRLKDPEFPQPIAIAPGIRGWREDEVDAWIARQENAKPEVRNAAARDAGRAAYWARVRAGESLAPRARAHREAATREADERLGGKP